MGHASKWAFAWEDGAGMVIILSGNQTLHRTRGRFIEA